LTKLSQAWPFAFLGVLNFLRAFAYKYYDSKNLDQVLAWNFAASSMQQAA